MDIKDARRKLRTWGNYLYRSMYEFSGYSNPIVAIMDTGVRTDSGYTDGAYDFLDKPYDFIAVENAITDISDSHLSVLFIEYTGDRGVSLNKKAKRAGLTPYKYKKRLLSAEEFVYINLKRYYN